MRETVHPPSRHKNTDAKTFLLTCNNKRRAFMSEACVDTGQEKPLRRMSSIQTNQFSWRLWKFHLKCWVQIVCFQFGTSHLPHHSFLALAPQYHSTQITAACSSASFNIHVRGLAQRQMFGYYARRACASAACLCWWVWSESGLGNPQLRLLPDNNANAATSQSKRHHQIKKPTCML